MAEREPTAEERITGHGAVMLTDLPVGAKVRLRGEAIGEVTANPRDGGWVFVRYLESPKDPAKVGTGSRSSAPTCSRRLCRSR